MQTETTQDVNLVGEYKTRREHGRHPVKVWRTRSGKQYELVAPEGSKKYRSFKALLRDVCGKDNMTFKQYFYLDSKGSPVSQPPPGIDLEKRGNEVRKILLAKFGGWINSSGYDPEEILQEVHLGLLRRNQGRCVFDPRKSSFGHYVFMVCNGVLANYHRRDKKRKAHEQIGILRFTEDGLMLVDVAEADVEVRIPEQDLSEEFSAVERLQDWISKRSSDELSQAAVKALPLVRKGFRRKEIAEKMGWSVGKTGKVLRHIRQSAQKWYELN